MYVLANSSTEETSWQKHWKPYSLKIPNKIECEEIRNVTAIMSVKAVFMTIMKQKKY